MPSGDIHLVRELIALQEPLRAMPLVNRRWQYDYAETAFGVQVVPGERIEANGSSAEWVLMHEDPRRPVVIYLHGGGYSLGSSRSHRHLAAAIGHAAGAAVLSVDYRRAPEFAFPAAVDDAVAAICWTIESTDVPVVLAGDSAGGGLVVASLVAIRDAGLPLPKAGVCLSPWVDLTCGADAHKRLADRDPLLSSAELERMAHSYLRDADSDHPLASPVFAELAGLPPLLIQVGTEEILLDDARKLASAARAAEVQVTLQEWPEMIHAWHWYFPVLEEGRQAIAGVGEFIRRHVKSKDLTSKPRKSGDVCPVPASSIQEAHLLISDLTSGRGYLSWVYQLNGRLDVSALANAIDDVVRRHEILRVRFQSRNGRMYQVVAPFTPGVLRVVDLSGGTKREGIDAAIEDTEALYRSLSPIESSHFRATIYTIDHKTSVLAMFVAEALVDSDSGSLLAAEIARAYARHHGSPTPPGLPTVRDSLWSDSVPFHSEGQEAVARAREYWLRQAQNAPSLSGWPTANRLGKVAASTVAFEFSQAEWERVAAGAQALRSTPYAFVLTCLQLTLAQVASVKRFLVHSVVSVRGDKSEGIIGNFHSLVRIEMRFDSKSDFAGALARTAVAVGEAIEHCVVPAPLTGFGTLSILPSGDALPGVRFYVFANHEGPVFDGIRRRRFRLHGVVPAPLSVSCIYAPNGRQDFVLSSTTATRDRLGVLADALRKTILVMGEEPRMSVSSVLVKKAGE